MIRCWIGLTLLGLSTAHWPTICNEALWSNTLDGVSAVMGTPDCGEVGAASANDPSIVSDFCFSDGVLDNNTVIVNFSRPFLVRRLQLLPVSFSTEGTNYYPETVRVAANNTEGKENWYRTPFDADNNAAWSVVPVEGDMIDISSDGLEARSLRFFPFTTQEQAIRFRLRIYGCPLSKTGSVDYVFRSSSLSSIELAFGHVGMFKRKILEVIQEETGLDMGRIRAQTDTDSNGMVDVSLMVLPDATTRSPTVKELVAVLSTNDALRKRLDELQTSIVDVASKLCVNKQCPTGTICIKGQCATKDGGFLGSAPEKPKIDASANMRRIIATAPMLDGSGAIKMIGMPQLIAIVVIGGTMLAIVSIGLTRVYKRMKLNHGNIE